MSGVPLLVVMLERVAASVSAFSAFVFRFVFENDAATPLTSHVVSKLNAMTFITTFSFGVSFVFTEGSKRTHFVSFKTVMGKGFFLWAWIFKTQKKNDDFQKLQI